MSSTDDSFNATGSVVAFETLNDNNQGFGVSVTGSQCGVYGESSRSPVGTRPPRGDVPNGTGVAGRGDSCGVQGASEKVGVQGSGGKKGTGVFGGGNEGPGVKGQSNFGDAVVGKSISGGRGGVFESDRSAQVQLVPHAVGGSFSNPVATPVMVIPIKEGPSLPKRARSGDLMAVVDRTKQCTLWFCVKNSEGTAPAKWAQVLLGGPFDGVG
jgi:hypothetical protein